MDIKSIMNFEISDAFKKTKLADWIKKYYTYILAFFVPGLIFLCANKVFGFGVLGDRNIMVWDMNAQYVYFFEMLKRVFDGDASLFMSWSKHLSGEAIGLFAYYLSSPFNLILALFSKENIISGIFCIQILKVSASGLTFNFYLRNSRNIKNHSTFIFSCFYALSMYMVANVINIMWIDAIVWMPIIIYGIEKIIDEGKSLTFIISLAVLMFSNYYISYMVILFSIIYFLIYLWQKNSEEKFFSKNNLMKFIKFAVSGIVSALSAGILLLPTYFSLRLGRMSGDFSSAATFETNFELYKFFPKFLPNSFDSLWSDGSPMIYCGVLTLIMLPLYFLNTEIKKRDKIGAGVLIGILFISVYTQPLDFIWHVFKYPHGVPYRYAFLFAFVFVVLAAEAFNHLKGISFKQIAITVAVLIGYLIYLSSIELKHIEEDYTIFWSFAFIISFALLLYFIKKKGNSKILTYVLTGLMVVELFGSTLNTFVDINLKHRYAGNTQYVDKMNNGREVIGYIDDIDKGLFYRVGRLDNVTSSDSMAIGYKSVNHSSSTFNQNALNFLLNIGFPTGKITTSYDIVTPFANDLLGIKYIVTTTPDDEFMGFDTKTTWDMSLITDIIPYTKKVFVRDGKNIYLGKEAEEFKENKNSMNKEISTADKSLTDQQVFENETALSLGFMVDKGVRNVTLNNENTIENQNMLLNSMLGNDIRYYNLIDGVEKETTNLKSTKTEGGYNYEVIDDKNPAHIILNLKAPDENQIYAYLDFRNLLKNDKDDLELIISKLMVNNKLFSNEVTDVRKIKYLSSFKKGEDVKYDIYLRTPKISLNDYAFYSFNEAEYAKAIDKLSKNQYNITTFKDTFIEGTIHADENQVMMTTISYEPGWTVKVDGKKVEHFAICDGVIGVPMEAGDHVVTFSFFPHGLKAGIIISIIGILAIVLIGLYERKKKNINKA